MSFSPIVQQRIDGWNKASIAFGPLLRGEADSLVDAREDYLKALAVHPAPDGVSVEEIDMGGLPGTVVTPEVVEDGRVLLYIHGGYVAGAAAGYHGLAGHYATLIMKYPIRSVEDLGLAISAVRRSTGVRQDDLAGAVGVSRQFTVDVEKGKPTVQLGRALLLLEELGIALNVEIPEEAFRLLPKLRSQRHAKLKISQGAVGDELGQVADE